MQLVWRFPGRFTVAFYGGSTLSFRPSDFGAQRLPRSTILERSSGGAVATILRSDCPALLFWSGAVEERQRRYCGATAQLYYSGAEPWRSSSDDTVERLHTVMHTSRVSSTRYSASRVVFCLKIASLYSSRTRLYSPLPATHFALWHCV
jgi:hypothetical protein